MVYFVGIIWMEGRFTLEFCFSENLAKAVIAMTKSNLEDFRNKKKELQKQKNAIEETIETKKRAIEIEAGNIRTLGQINNGYEAMRDMYDDVNESYVTQMGDQDYSIFSRPISDLVTSGAIILSIRDQSRSALKSAEMHDALLASSASGTSATAYSIDVVSSNFAWCFPNREQIVAQYEPRRKLEDEIDYIKNQLSIIDPDVCRDFEAFLQKFYIGDVETKYQDLIGFRSMFFLRLIFEFSERTYGTTGRRKQIKRFVFGSTPYNTTADTIIKGAMDLWSELSDQDSIGNSVKLGHVTKTYVETIFPITIGVIASLLKLRERVFRV